MNIAELYNIYLQHQKVITDSRQIERGCIFFALKGDRFNGNKYAAAALEQGASYAIIDEVDYQVNANCILVHDVLETLQALANYHRLQLDIPVIGITGSNGKTTTKELVSHVLATEYKTASTKGNFNNHIGVPLTLLAIPTDTAIAVVEMGANHQGEIGFLSEIAEPTHGIINNIGKAHLEGFGGIEGIKKGKSELYAFLAAHEGTALINTDLPFLKELADQRNVKNRIEYSQQKGQDYTIELLSVEPFVQFNIKEKDEIIKVQSHLIGAYNFDNILSAIAIGKYFKISNQQIKTAIEGYIPQNNRSQIVKKETNTFILDAYNANPTSTKHAVEHFSTIQNKEKIVILGDMLELGDYSVIEHQTMANLVTTLSFSQVILVGPEYAKAANSIDCLYFENVQLLKEWFSTKVFNDTYFLIKGSRGIRLELLLK
jgi:UDP-N-acetylmuramoyl-tripeptide--D-alanyl-D-alanine ligase